MKRFFFRILILGAILFVSYALWDWDSSVPTVHWREAPAVVGETSKIVLEMEDLGKGFQFIEVLLSSPGTSQILLSETYKAPWPWQPTDNYHSLALSPEISFSTKLLSEGEFFLEITMRDHPNLWFWSREISTRRSFKLDLTPPEIQVLTDQHYIRQGGSEAIIYSVSEDISSSGVQVGTHSFQGYQLIDGEQDYYVCLFALAHDQELDVDIALWAEDIAGNRKQRAFWKKTFPISSRDRDIHLSDSLINSLLPEILENQTEVTLQETPLETFLKINGHLRQLNHQKIQEISRNSADTLLWSAPFIQLSRSQVESLFADHRTYYYQGQPVDKQTHLGFDLASVRHGPVESANAGIVAFADYLGIYGNTVLVDHGLGLFSLYGHLSSLEVQHGQKVELGQILGRTGQTGLAAGDHLHFSMILQGVQVTPVEWWDARWVKQHVLDRVLRSWGP
ncbi:MAG: M23 family metallopeptidase [Acidobacteriota bacterium]|nr:M23 family metallopeptidase [Acidobacteriota bacterium]